MNFISGIGGRRTGSHSAGKFTMTEYPSSRAEGRWSSPAPELRTLVSWQSEYLVKNGLADRIDNEVINRDNLSLS